MSEYNGNRKTDEIFIAFLIVFIVLSVSLTLFIIYQQVIINKTAEKITASDLELEKLNDFIADQEARYNRLQEMSDENQLLKKSSEIYRARNYQLESLLNTDISRNGKPYKIVFLTFDDGPSPNTGKILDILKQYSIKATFFVVGRETESSLELYKRIVDEGHTLGNHSYSHDYGYIYKSKENFYTDFYRLEDLLYNTTGVRPAVVRFPGGSNNHISRKYGGDDIMQKLTSDLTERGYYYVDWDIESGDASRIVRSKKYLTDQILGNIQYYNDAVILFHDTYRNTTTVEVLPVIIESLLKDGYVFLPVTERYESFLPRFN